MPREADSLAYRSIHAQLEGELDDLFAKAERDLAAWPPASRRAGPLRSLLKHRDGLCVFLDHPRVPQDNNIAELSLREAVILRKLCFGSDSKEGARLTAVMLTVLRTLAKTGLDAQTWLHSWLTALCGKRSGPSRGPVMLAALVHGCGPSSGLHCLFMTARACHGGLVMPVPGEAPPTGLTNRI